MTDGLLALALVGSRAQGFNHDCASKLQGMMMALDELGELSEDPEVQRCATAIGTSLADLTALIREYRTLVKASIHTPARTATTVRALFAAAAERVGVRLDGDVPDAPVTVAAHAIVQSLSLLLDVAAEPSPRRATIADGAIACARVVPPETIAIATFALARDGATLVVTPAGIAISFA